MKGGCDEHGVAEFDGGGDVRMVISNRHLCRSKTMQKMSSYLSTLVLSLVIGSLWMSAQTPTLARGIAVDDLAHRDPAIHWPKQFDPATAAQFSHNELLIPAPCEHVFARMADITAWPTWFILVKCQGGGAGPIARAWAHAFALYLQHTYHREDYGMGARRTYQLAAGNRRTIRVESLPRVALRAGRRRVQSGDGRSGCGTRR